jgi:hypothetical protein
MANRVPRRLSHNAPSSKELRKKPPSGHFEILFGQSASGDASNGNSGSYPAVSVWRVCGGLVRLTVTHQRMPSEILPFAMHYVKEGSKGEP